MRRFFAATLDLSGGEVILPSETADHMRVLRLSVGDEVCLFDGEGRQAVARITRLDAGAAICESQPAGSVAPTGPRMRLLLAMPKGSKLDAAVRMATEFGVSEITLLETEHSVPRWNTNRAAQKLARLSRVALEAARQSGQVRPAAVHPPTSLQAALDTLEATGSRLAFTVRARDTAPQIVAGTHTITIAVGPEGGFSETEVECLCLNRFSEVSLGPSILRVDTALAAALGVVADRVTAAQNLVD